MRINRKKVLSTFKTYTERYDLKNEKIFLKAQHTYNVAKHCQAIAESLGLPQEDVDLAWLSGMLHDVGRFEQLRIYDTFVDADSIDHAQFGADLLFGRSSSFQKTGLVKEEVNKEQLNNEYLIDSYDVNLNTEDLLLLETAIRDHSLYRISESLSEREKLFCNILRDADKIDIFRVNVDFDMDMIINCSKEELEQSEVTPEVKQAFMEHHAILRSLKKTPADYVVGHQSLLWELVYPYSRELVVKQGYAEKLLSFQSKNPEAIKDFKDMRDELREVAGI